MTGNVSAGREARDRSSTWLARGGTPHLQALFGPPSVTLQRGDMLVEDGQRVAQVYRVVAGWLGRSRYSNDGKKSMTAIYMVGDYIGLDGVVEDQHLDDVVAFGPCTLSAIPIAHLRSAYDERSDVARDVACWLIADQDWVREGLVAISTRPTLERFITFIYDRYQRLLMSGMEMPDSGTFAMPLTQSDIAAALGVSDVHVNRVLQQLRAAEILDYRRDQTIIRDFNAIREIAEHGSEAARAILGADDGAGAAAP